MDRKCDFIWISTRRNILRRETAAERNPGEKSSQRNPNHDKGHGGQLKVDR